MTRRRNRLWSMLCVIALAQAAVVFRCDSCVLGECGASIAGCCQGGTGPAPECPLCEAAAKAEKECGSEQEDSHPCRCVWKAKTRLPMTADRIASIDLDQDVPVFVPTERHQLAGIQQPLRAGGQPRVPIPERPARILYGVWRN